MSTVKKSFRLDDSVLEKYKEIYSEENEIYKVLHKDLFAKMVACYREHCYELISTLDPHKGPRFYTGTDKEEQTNEKICKSLSNEINDIQKQYGLNETEACNRLADKILEGNTDSSKKSHDLARRIAAAAKGRVVTLANAIELAEKTEINLLLTLLPTNDTPPYNLLHRAFERLEYKEIAKNRLTTLIKRIATEIIEEVNNERDFDKVIKRYTGI